MSKPLIEAPFQKYSRYGSSVRANRDRSIDVNCPLNLRAAMLLHDEESQIDSVMENLIEDHEVSEYL
ncbi:MAG: hypothetical protein ABSD49_01780 [Candidatus Bathyarchaeia archaeon]